MEYWEHVWSAEDPARISALQDAWARSCGEMIELFRPCGAAERRELFRGLEPLWEHTAANGKHTVVLRR